MREQLEYVAHKLQRAREFQVNIVIGPAVELFKKIYKGDYDTITTAQEVRDFLAKWSVATDKPIVFEDISLMQPQVQTFLLKFIEEPPSPIIILASKDNVSPIILSRFKNIVKIPCDVHNTTMSLKDFIKYKQDYIDEQKAKVKLKEQPSVIPFNDEEESYDKCHDYLYIYNSIKSETIHNIDIYIKLLNYGD